MELLRRGSTGSAVTGLQQELRARAALIQDPPGSFGLWTEVALCLLQRSAGLDVDGVLGPQTEALLKGPAPADYAARAAAPLKLIAGVPYRTQRDNAHSPGGSCNVTTLAMALLHRGIQPKRAGVQLEDELFDLLRTEEATEFYRGSNADLFRQGRPANEVYDNLAWAAGRHGVPASFSGHRSMEEIHAEVREDRPVMLSGQFTGSGHIVLLIGLSVDGDLICHDPYGDWTTGYRSRDGAARLYPQERVHAVLKEVGSSEKWALFLRL